MAKKEAQQTQTIQNQEKDTSFSAVYNGLKAKVEKLFQEERTSILKRNHQVGTVILEYKNQIASAQNDTDERGWSGLLGRLMKQLASDYDKSVEELYRYIQFAKKYPSYDEFERETFEVRVSRTERVSGEKLSWHIVREQLVPGTQLSESKEE